LQGIEKINPRGLWSRGFFIWGNRLQNSVTKFPELYVCNHLQAGLCGYSNETILLSQDAMARMAPTFNGKPVYILHQDVEFDKMKQDAVGYVADTWLAGDGWLWSRIIITDDEAHKVIAEGYSVSNAYNPTEFKGGGMHHNLPYTREIMNGEFTHLALVPDPRYEDAKVYTLEEYQARNTTLMNSLEPKPPANQPAKKGNFMLKFFKNQKTEVDASEADIVEYTNAKGETVTRSLSEMVNAVEEKEKANKAMKNKVMVNGEEMTVADLVKKYEEMENEDKDDKDADKENEGDEDQDDADAEAEEREEEEKKNAKAKADAIRNAAGNAPSRTVVIETRTTQLNRGKSVYGTKK
jgi:hypothetical protein